MPEPLVCICISTGGMIHSNTVSCLLDSLPKMSFTKYVALMSGGYKQNSLTMAWNAAKQRGATHFMSIDNDMIFPPDGIAKLLEQDKDIIGATYNERRFPLRSTVKITDESGNLVAGDISKYAEPFKVYSLGLGFVLIKMSAFDKIQKPFFNDPIDEHDNFTTDDFYLFDKFQKAGVEVWCDPRIVVKHIGTYLY